MASKRPASAMSSSSSSEPSAKRYHQKFKPEYAKKYPCLIASKISVHHFRCIICESDYKCSAGGSNDCKRHIETESHKIKSKPTNVKKLTSYFDQPVSTKVKEQDTKTRKAELIMCSFIVKHNLPFAAMDSLSEAVRQSFPDSGIASGFKCGRTKTTSLIKEMGCQEIERLAGLMKANPFSIATDGSNDMVGGRKYYPLVVRVCTPNGVDGGLLALRNCEGQSTGENIFNLVDAELKVHNIPWENCLSLGSDNAPNMVGHKSGVIAYARKENTGVFKSGCIIHLVHIAAKKGSAELRPIEEALVDIYYYFKKSANRQNNFKKLQVMFHLEQKKCLKHVSTRWLSIQNGVERLLLNWVALKEFFLEESRNQKTDLGKGKAKAILEFLKSSTNHLHSTFLLYATKLFNPLLVGLQAEEPLIHTVRHEMEMLMQQLMTKYIKPSFLVGKKPTELQHKKADLQKEDKDLGIGVEALMLLANAEENHLRQSRLPDFYRAVRKFYQTAVDYLLKSLPWEDPFLKSVAVVDITQRMTASKLDLLTLLKRFPCLMTAGDTIDDHLSMLDLLTATELGDLSGPLDKQYCSIAARHPHLKRLCRAMIGLLTVPHSSAACERVFSVVRKNLTDQRGSMGEDSMEALLVLKSSPGDFSQRIRDIQAMDDDSLERVKSACRLSLL